MARSYRETLEAEGRRIIQQQVDAILNTSQTLVTIHYGAAGDIRGLGYTPFGVTAVNDHTAIYDLVPAELTLSGSPATTIAISGNKVSIDLR